MNNKYKFWFLLWLAVIPLGGVILDLFMSTISPDPEYGDSTQHFDLSIINQITYLSVWNATFTSIWGICNLINLKTNKLPNWIVEKNSFTFVLSLNVVVFLIYTFTMIVTPGGIVGFNTWYKILKSVSEHFMTPPILVVFYFLTIHQYKSEKEYASRDGFWTLIFMGSYAAFVLIRCIMIHEFDPTMQNSDNSDNWFTPFPYDQVDPYSKPIWMCLIGYLLIAFAPYGVGNFFNWLSNKSSRSLVHKLNNRSENKFWPQEEKWNTYK